MVVARPASHGHGGRGLRGGSKATARRALLTPSTRGFPLQVAAPGEAQAEHVVVTIEDARPNRPTFQQVSDKPGLDAMRSISIGGAKVSGVAFDASGKEIGRLDYNWYETDLSNSFGTATWTDARTTFARFANRFADKLS